MRAPFTQENSARVLWNRRPPGAEDAPPVDTLGAAALRAGTLVRVRPVLKPALRLLWRDTSTLQLGVDRRHAVVLDLVEPSSAAVLGLLDGTRDWAGVLSAAAERGLDPDCAEEVLLLLAQHHALDDAAQPAVGRTRAERDRRAPDLASLSLLHPQPGVAARQLVRRRAASVLVIGAGRVGGSCVALLLAAGVGRVSVLDERPVSAADAMPGAVQPRERGGRAAAVVRSVSDAGGAVDVVAAVHPADVAVIAPDGLAPADPAVCATLHGARTPYVVAAVRETTGVVGPFVVPGDSACPRCVDLARADRDAAWPALAGQLAAPRPGTEVCDLALAAAVAAIAAGQVLAWLADPGSVAARDALLELQLPEWSMRRRECGVHPRCPCTSAIAATG